jgi:hypothetical protein
METVILPKGTVVKLNGFPCELMQDTEVSSATIAGMGGLEAFLRWSEDGQGEATPTYEAEPAVAH